MWLGEIWWLDAERFSQVKSYEKAAGGDIKIFCGWKHENILVLKENGTFTAGFGLFKNGTLKKQRLLGEINPIPPPKNLKVMENRLPVYER